MIYLFVPDNGYAYTSVQCETDSFLLGKIKDGLIQVFRINNEEILQLRIKGNLTLRWESQWIPVGKEK